MAVVEECVEPILRFHFHAKGIHSLRRHPVGLSPRAAKGGKIAIGTEECVNGDANASSYAVFYRHGLIQ